MALGSDASRLSAGEKGTFERLVSQVAPVKAFVGTKVDGSELRYGKDMQTINPAKIVTDPETGEARRNGSWEYHSDDSYMSVPGRFTCLHPQELPSSGGDTEFLDMRTAFETLPAEKRAEVERLRCVHHMYNHGLFAAHRADIVGNGVKARDPLVVEEKQKAGLADTTPLAGEALATRKTSKNQIDRPVQRE